MPNGRSGGFIMEKADLARLVKTMPEDIGATAALSDSPMPGPINARRWLSYSIDARMIAWPSRNRIIFFAASSISESTGNHLGRDLAEVANSPGYREWARANPGWKGWIGF